MGKERWYSRVFGPVKNVWKGFFRIFKRTFWGYPLISVIFNLGFAWFLCGITLDPSKYDGLGVETCRYCVFIFTGSVGGARAAANHVSNAAISIATLTFSLTVLSMQLAAFNYTPRILDEFLKDPVTKLSLSVYLGTYAYCFVLLTKIQDESESMEAFVPIIAVNLLTIYLIAVLLTFVFFTQYFVKGMQLETVLKKASRSAKRALARLDKFADKKQDEEEETALDKKCKPLEEIPENAIRILANANGYVAEWTLSSIVPILVDLSAKIRYNCYSGEFVTEGTEIGWMWSTKGTTDDLLDRVKNLELFKTQNESMVDTLSLIGKRGIYLAASREGQADISLGVRQLSDIAVRALSPGTNDPQSAIQVMDSLSVVFAKLSKSVLPNNVEYHPEREDETVAMSPERTFSFLLATAIDPIRAYGASDINVVRRALYFLSDVGSICQRLEQEERVKAVVSELEAWMKAAENNFGESSPEMADLNRSMEHVNKVLDAIKREQKNRNTTVNDHEVERMERGDNEEAPSAADEHENTSSSSNITEQQSQASVGEDNS